ncbi:MAG: hypothetical protein ABI919_03175, partial [Ramlibacter sp.]
MTYPVGRSRFVGYLVFVAAGCGLAMIALGALQAQTPPWVAGFGLVSALAAGCWAGLRWWRTPEGDLS